MLEKWKQQWGAFKRAPPGERFLRRYQARKRGGHPGLRIVSVVVGLVLVVGGAVLLVIPGPGLLVIGFGGALIAQEFRWAAVALDRTEVALRKWARFGARFWESASVAVRVLVVALAGILAAGAGYLAWKWFLA
jgi:Putative transmembrane protein (PGPGW)